MPNLRLQLILFMALMTSFFLQYYVVLPVEFWLSQETAAQYASLVYLPQGVKVVAIAFVGVQALAPMILAHLLIYTLMGMDTGYMLFTSSVSVLAILIPLILFNYLTERPLFLPVLSQYLKGINLFRSVLVYAFAAALINALAMASWHVEIGIHSLALRYVFGDIFGTLVVLMLLIGVKTILVSIGQRYISSP